MSFSFVFQAKKVKEIQYVAIEEKDKGKKKENRNKKEYRLH